MILSSPETIRTYTNAGWWGTTTLLDLWDANVAAHPERVALVDPPNRAELSVGQPQRWTYAETDARATRLAAALHEAGVGRDDVVMVQLPNIVELPLVYLAALKLGAVVSPLPVQYRQHELRHTMSVVEPRAFITTTRCTGFDHLAMLCALRAEVGSLDLVMGLAEEDEALPHGVLALRGILEADDALPAFDGPTPGWDANEITTICWTSGTEAEPKGVPRSHNMWISIAYGTTDGARLADGAVMLNPFPMVNMSGIGGMLVPWLQVAGTLVMHHPMSLPVFLAQVGTERAEYTVAPPILLNMLLANEALLASADLSSMRVIGSGSAPLSAFMVEGWKRRFGIDVLNFFGSNEGIALVGDPVTVPDPGERARYFPRFGTPGHDSGERANRVAAGMESRLVDPISGELVTEPDQPGELAFRGPTLFPGYYRRPEMTARAFDADGFYRTGDLFEVPAERPDRLRFVGRARDLIVRGGMKVAPEELESLIATHPAVAEVAVVGIEDRRLEGEQRISVVAVIRPGTSLTLGELRAHLAARQIASYKLPKELLVVDALPRNPVGKILKRDLRMRLEGRGSGRSVAEDSTQFELYPPGTAVGPGAALPAPGTGIPGTQVTYEPGAPGVAPTWVRYATLLPAACGRYLLRSAVLANDPANSSGEGDDDNGWRLRVGTDNDGDPTNAPPANASDPDGIPGSNDEPLIGSDQVTFQQDTGGTSCLTLYRYVDPGMPSVTFNNFDMDGNTRVTYYAPSEVVDPSGVVGGTPGTLSGNGAWNGDGLSRAGDTIADPEAGWWAIVSCISSNNQFIEDRTPNDIGFLAQPPSPALTLRKDDGVATTSPGATLTYELTATNTATGPTAGAALAVVLSDQLPAGVSFVGCAFASPATGGCDASGGTVTGTLTGWINAGASITLDVTVTVQSESAGEAAHA